MYILSYFAKLIFLKKIFSSMYVNCNKILHLLFYHVFHKRQILALRTGTFLIVATL